MTPTERTNGEKLFDALCSLDDRIIAEAEMPPRRLGASTLKKTATTLIALAACISIVFTGFFGAALFIHVRDMLRPVEDELSAPTTLDAVLQNATGDAVQTHASKEEINLFDGNLTLIWQTEDEMPIRSLTLNAYTEKAELEAILDRNRQPIAENDEIACKVWISYGDGRVVSPYLLSSDGNVGYGTLFDYSPEVIPDDALTELISESLGKS